MSAGLPFFSADEVFARVSFADAVRAVQNALVAGLDPSLDPSRTILDLTAGQLLLMPSESADFVGTKIASVAPGNPTLGLPRIQGTYLLMDATTLAPIALLDGTALTTLRTPAVSAAAADYLAPPEVDHLVVFGSGPQAWGHIEALRAIRTIARISVVGRNPARAEALAARVSVSGIPARIGAASDVRDAQLIVCATTAHSPLFDGTLVPDDSCSIAVGSHEPEVRELDSSIMARAQIAVEDVNAALREAGDVMVPLAEGLIASRSLIPLLDLATGAATADRSRPRVFKSVGMSWEDLVVASAVYTAGQTSAS